jgi:leader peptidase (prepilin peptidase)/N-methyltransferase
VAPPLILGFGLAVVAGLILGSFFNVLIYRLPRHESIIRPGSHCPGCHDPIRPIDNVPILSYLLLGGKCRRCRARIPIRYPLVEIVTPLSFVSLILRFGISPALVPALLLVSVLIVAFFTDLETGLIPNRLTYPAIIVSLLLVPIAGRGISGGSWESVWGLVVMGGGLFLLHLIGPLFLGKETMGLGDVKLGIVMGLLLGWRLSLISLYAAFFLGAAVGLVILIGSREKQLRKVPFGPFLAVGGGVALWLGNEILDAYWTFLGG